jgi:hypothetical protein
MHEEAKKRGGKEGRKKKLKKYFIAKNKKTSRPFLDRRPRVLRGKYDRKSKSGN